MSARGIQAYHSFVYAPPSEMLAPGEPVIFDETLVKWYNPHPQDSYSVHVNQIIYTKTSGSFTIITMSDTENKFYIAWWVALKTGLDPNGSTFGIHIEDENHNLFGNYPASSSLKTTNISSSLFINLPSSLDSSTQTRYFISLTNQSNAISAYHNTVFSEANIIIVSLSE